MAFIAVLLLAIAVVASDAQRDNALHLIEVALNNISSQISVLSTREEQIPAYLGESLTSVTSLLQLSLLREMVTDKKGPEECCCPTLVDISERLQKQVIAISSQLTSMQNTLQMLVSKSNVHQETLDDISDNVANDTGTDPLPHSCEDILASSPASPSDYYTIADSNGHTRQVYCHMDKDICDSQGGWTRIAMIDMTDTEQLCPEGFKLYNVNGVRACGRPGSGCLSLTFPSDELTYSQVCGKVLGYQYYSPDGIVGNDINGAYLDGISLTHGHPRQHIWSYICGLLENNRQSRCPCGSVDRTNTPSFVGNDYYCESGNPNNNWTPTLYTGDILWDGSGCGNVEQSCCNRAGMPWFHKTLGYTTTDYVELRVCGDQDDEDIPFSHVELYIK